MNYSSSVADLEQSCQRRRRRSDEFRLNEVATRNTITRMLQGVRTSGNAQMNFVPDPVIDIITRAVGPRQRAPQELFDLARKRTVLLEGHKLIWHNTTTNEKCDLSFVNENWWFETTTLLKKMSRFANRKIYFEASQLQSFCMFSHSLHDPILNQKYTDEHREEFNFMSPTNDHIENWDSIAQFANKLQFCFEFDKDDPNEPEDKLRSNEVMSLLMHLPEEYLSPSRGFGVILNHTDDKSYVTVIVCGPDLMEKTKQPLDLLDIVQLYRNRMISEYTKNGVEFVDQSFFIGQRDATQHCIFPFDQMLDRHDHLATNDFYQFKLKWWSTWMNNLYNWSDQFDCQCELIQAHLKEGLHPKRSAQSSQNMHIDSRDIAMYFPDFMNNTLVIDQWSHFNTLQRQTQIRPFCFPSATWNALKINIVIKNVIPNTTTTQLLSHPCIAHFRKLCKHIVDLPNEQLGMSLSRTDKDNYITGHLEIVLYSPKYVQSCISFDSTFDDNNNDDNDDDDMDEQKNNDDAQLTTTQKALRILQDFKSNKPAMLS